MYLFYQTLTFCGNQLGMSPTKPFLQSVIELHYHFVYSCCLFLSDKTRAKIPDDDIVTKEGAKAKLKFVINLDSFIDDHIGFNIILWLNKILKKYTINPSYVGYHCVDGDSNAWASTEYFE